MTRAVHSPPFTVEDLALLNALDAWDASLCPGCHIPRAEAWHSDMEGWYDASGGVVCHACTAQRGRQVVYGGAATDRDFAAKPLPPFQIGVTTVPPDPPEPRAR